MQKQKQFFIFFIADNISISMYIMCVILCLLSALSRRVGALQICIIIIIIISVVVVVVVKKTGKSDLAENPKAQKWKLPFKKSHNAKVAWYPSDSFWKARSQM